MKMFYTEKRTCNGDEFTRSITNMATRSWGFYTDIGVVVGAVAVVVVVVFVVVLFVL